MAPALKSVKMAADQVFSKDQLKGLKDVWEERQTNVELVIWGHIDDSLVWHGHTQAVVLAQEMLCKSLKFTNRLFWLSDQHQLRADWLLWLSPDQHLVAGNRGDCCTDLQVLENGSQWNPQHFD
jgi:hypothetical protein